MPKKSDSPIKLVVVLFAIAAITALALGLTNLLTADKITAIKADKTADALTEVFPGDYTFEKLEYTADDPTIKTIYRVVSDLGGEGYIIEVTPSGFGGAIDMVVGFNPMGAVTGISIISSSETSGLGTNASKPEFKDQYIGGEPPFSVNKDGGDITAITGATITSRAVTKGVNAAADALAALLGGSDGSSINIILSTNPGEARP